jgi:bifunctional DNA-binding transcriptional regulator/antitoxin component of YhaV-PrlF toxin-antitoxin module
MTTVYTLPVQHNAETDEHYIEFPPEVLEGTGWKEGDTLVWTDNKDGSWTLTKKTS